MNKVLGFERINERRQRPNKLINFIKPLEGSDKELAQDFLERVAAICYPIMKANHVVVMSLEEYPPNKEFWGRNFNAGEIIQLVLKSPGSGQWLPFKHVQMVMMHELAHCKQMNHSRDFWKVNNANRDELKALWASNYTGEGLWGCGQTLLSGRYSMDHMLNAAEAPSNLCGGTYRSRGGRKRKRADGDAPKLTYAERKQRRIAKKFGVNGQALGADGYARLGLDQGRHRPSKPRVASSKRGRELRVAAALARFDKAKQDTPKQGSVDVSEDDYETDSDDDDDGASEVGGDWDDNDNLVKVCEHEEHDDGDAQRELNELRQIDQQATSENVTPMTKKQSASSHVEEADPRVIDLDDEDIAQIEPLVKKQGKKRYVPATVDLDSEPAGSTVGSQASTASEDEAHETKEIDSRKASTPSLGSDQTFPVARSSLRELPGPVSAATDPSTPAKNSTPSPSPTTACQACSFANEKGAATCMVCSHVMDTRKIHNAWKCQSDACRGSVYLNLGDYGVCGVCHEHKQATDDVHGR